MNNYYDIFGMMNGQMNQIGLILCVIIVVLIIWLISILFIHRRHISRNGKLKQIIASIRLETDRLDEIIQKQKSVERDKEYLETANNELKNRAYQILDEFKSAGNSLRLCEEQITLAKTEIKDLNSHNESLQKELDEKQSVLDEILSAINQARKELESLNAGKKQLIDILKNKLEEVSQAKSELNDLRHENQQLISSVETLKRGKDSLLEEIEKIKKTPNDIKRIGYTPNADFKNDCYPAVYMPEAKSKLLLSGIGRSGSIGRMEQAIKNQLKELLKTNQLYVISDNFHLDISGSKRTYEPDLTIYNQTLNLYIDIEIDEPYYGNPPKYSHCINNNNDLQRNRYFVENGWVVIRFSEHQIVNQLQSCCKYIAEVISKIDNTFKIPDLFKYYSDIRTEKFWSEKDVEKWITEGYREKYLQLDVLPDTTNLSTFLNSIIQIERKSDLFDENTDNLFKNYIKGTLRNLPQNNRLFEQFRSFINDRVGITDENILEFGVKCTEFDIDSKIDLLAPKENNTYNLYCWRNTEAVEACQNVYSNNLQWNTDKEYNYVRYTVELNIYKKILEEKYDKKINDAYLVQLNENINYYELHPIHILPELTEKIISLLKHPLK